MVRQGRTPMQLHLHPPKAVYMKDIESTLARWARASAPGKVFPCFGVAPRVGVKDSHSSVWPPEWSVTHQRGILSF